jgi:SAM-dependent methyltransferase
MSDAMAAEFGTVAEWTAEAAVELGKDYYIPAACRGSGSPAALDWLIDHLALAPGETLLDCGAGVGGPAAYAAEQRSVRPVLVEPEAGACRGALALFDHPVVRAAGSMLPLADETFDAAWALGVLCTMQEQLELLTELRRVVRPAGRIGLLVFVVRAPGGDPPEGNNFPSVASLTHLLAQAELSIDDWQGTTELPPIPRAWLRREAEVTTRLRQRHGAKKSWRLAEDQSDTMARQLAESFISGELLTLHRT